MLKKINSKELDKLSWRILKELCADARISTTEIGRRVGLSAPAVAERVQKMQDQGYITGYRTTVDFDKIGLTIRAFISLRATSVSHDEMIRKVELIPEIIEWHAITGTYCMLIKVAVQSSKELEKVISDLGKIGETSTSLILSGSNCSQMIQELPTPKDV